MKKFALTAAAVLLAASSVSAAETADLKVRFEFGGPSVDLPNIVADKDSAFCGKHPIPDESLVIDPETKGIKDVILYVHTGRGGMKLPKMDPVNNTHTLENVDCRFEPHIVVAQAGDKLKITNPDPIAHNANISFLSNPGVNPTIPPGQFVMIDMEEAEPAPIPAVCNIHPWMKAMVVVTDHPYVGVSEADGTLTISGLPTGEVIFRIYHETIKVKEATQKVGGEKVEFKRAMWTLDLDAGMNDQGTLVIK